MEKPGIKNIQFNNEEIKIEELQNQSVELPKHTIQPEELRIGNLVFDKKRNRIVTVWGIESNHDKIVVNYANGSGVYSIDLKHIEPIPITEEILLRFGYEILRKNEFLFDNYFVAYINEEGKIEMYLFKGIEGDVYLCHIYFVHQLQNLHSSIRKEELQFKQTT